jgi:hypothetical protein
MSNQDWMSLAEIARLWSLETGDSAELIERDLNAWFSKFVAGQSSQGSGLPHDDGIAINRLMGLLGGRQLERETFAAYCVGRGCDMPRFWRVVEPETTQLEAPLLLEPSEVGATQRLHGFAPRSGPEARVPQGGCQIEMAGTAGEFDRREAGRPTRSLPASAPHLAWGAKIEALRSAVVHCIATARVSAPSVCAVALRKTRRLAKRGTLGLVLLVTGFVLGQGSVARSGLEPVAGGQDVVMAASLSSMQSELTIARQHIATLAIALEASERDVENLTRDLLTVRQDGAVAHDRAPMVARSHPTGPQTLGMDPEMDRESGDATGRKSGELGAVSPKEVPSPSVDGSEKAAGVGPDPRPVPLPAAPKPKFPLERNVEPTSLNTAARSGRAPSDDR